METKEEDKVKQVTEGGYEYVLAGDKKVRNSIAPGRLEEDGETFEEYKIRRKLVNDVDRRRTVWYSKTWGTNNAENRLSIYQSLMEKVKQEVETKEDGNN